MRHNYKVKKLGRQKDHRDMLVINQFKTLVQYGKLETTEQKAKVVAGFADKILSRLAKLDNERALQLLESKLKNKKFTKYLVEEIKPVLDREFGFVRKYKLETRKGDNASMMLLELIKKEQKSKKSNKKKEK